MFYKKYKIKYIVSFVLIIFLVSFFGVGICTENGKTPFLAGMYDGFYLKCVMADPVSSNMRSNKSGQKLFFERESLSSAGGGSLAFYVKSRLADDISNINKLYFISLLFITSYVLHFIMKYIERADGKK